MINLDLDLDEKQIIALSQYVKRVGFSDVRQNSIDDDEAYLVMDAIYQIAKSLKENGYDPR